MPTQVYFPDGSHAEIKYVGHNSNGDDVYRIKECICEDSESNYGICEDCGLEKRSIISHERSGVLKSVTSINRKER